MGFELLFTNVFNRILKLKLFERIKSKKKRFNFLKRFCGESRIRTCEVFTADLQSALVGRLSISPEPLSTTILLLLAVQI